MYVLWGKEGGKVKFVDKKVGPIVCGFKDIWWYITH